MNERTTTRLLSLDRSYMFCYFIVIAVGIAGMCHFVYPQLRSIDSREDICVQAHRT